jgi:small-conductance mechanosensitive channel
VKSFERAIELRRRRGAAWPRFLLLALVLFLPTQAPPQAATPGVPVAPDIIQFLSKTIYWYQQTQLEQQVVNDPNDLAFAESNREMAEQIVRLAFYFARQSAPLLERQSKSSLPDAQTNDSSTYRGLVQASASNDQKIQQTQTELQSLQLKRESVTAKKRQELDSQIDELKSELGLMQARADVLHTMLSFVNGAGGAGAGATGLRGQIAELARSVPPYLSEPEDRNPEDGSQDKSKEKNANDQARNQLSAAKTTLTAKQPYSGIWGLVADLFHLSLKTRTLTQDVKLADVLLQSGNQLRTPLIGSLRQMIQSSNQVAVEADTADPATLAKEKEQLDALTAQFKQVSAAAIPLEQQAILLDLYKRNLTNWRVSVRSQYLADLKNLIVRLAVLAILVGAILGFGELWRKTINRYVQDARRHYQLLLLRRIVLWAGIALVLIFTFASELGSVFTFAGLITAGVAVALQNVILSIVGYFFLIGKYGIRVGDRVQVSGVTGSVIEIGLVRFYLMELDTSESDSLPTGRVVAFSNSIVFQATAGLFKQIPGTSFLWHEIKLTFAAESDYQAVRERVEQAVESAFKDYRDSLERQQQQMERSLTSISAVELKPKVRLYFGPSGLETLIRYPVVLQKAQEIDEHLMAAIFSAVEREPKLKLIGSEIPASKVAA